MDPSKLKEIEIEVLTNKRHYLVKNIKPEDILDALIQKKLIGTSAKQNFELLVTTTDKKVQIILDDLERSHPGFLNEFCEVLDDSKTQGHVVKELQQEFQSVKLKHGFPSKGVSAFLDYSVSDPVVRKVEEHIGETAKPPTVPKVEIGIGELAQQKPPVQIKDFASVYGVLSRRAVHKWKQIGSQLDLESYELDAIAADSKDDPEENMSKVFELWKQQSLNQTWNDLIQAVEQTNLNPQLCMDLNTKHGTETEKKVSMKELSNEVLLPMAEHWYDFGLALGIDETQLGIITPANTNTFFRKMLQSWWQQNIASDRTWNKIVSALDAVKINKVAKEVYDNNIL